MSTPDVAINSTFMTGSIPTPSTATGQTVEVNGARLYYEMKGSGPSVLLISGATGDAGHFDQLAGLLADEFTVVTYDRRGNSRSPRPPGWDQTSMDEQADDVAGLLHALGIAPAAVFGTSGAAVILLNLMLRRPDVLRGAIIHEPPLIQVLPNAVETAAVLQSMVEEGLTRAGPRGTMEMFVRANAGDATFENLNPELRERMLGNAELFLFTEMEAFASYVPDPVSLSAVQIPVLVVGGAENRGLYYYEACKWVAAQLGTGLQEIPGGHASYMDRASDVADAIRPFIKQIS